MTEGFAWYDKNTGEFFLEGLRDSQAAAGVYLNAGVTFTVEAIRNAAKQVIVAGPFAGSYVTGSEGVWAARIGWQSALVGGRKYWAELKAVVGGVDGTWQVEFEVRERVVR